MQFGFRWEKQFSAERIWFLLLKKTKQNKTQLIYPLLTLADASSHNMEAFLLASSLISLHFWVNWAGWLKKKNCWGSCWAWAGWAWTGLLANLHQCPLQVARLAFLVLLPASVGLLNQIQMTFAHGPLWAGAPCQEALFAEWSCVYLPLGVAAVASGFVAWGGQWGVQPFVITWFLTHLPHLLDGRLAAFPHTPEPWITQEGRVWSRTHSLTHPAPLYYPL